MAADVKARGSFHFQLPFGTLKETRGISSPSCSSNLYNLKKAAVSVKFEAAAAMSGAQGAQPKGSLTATTYESVQGGENRTRTDIRSKDDQGKIEIDKIQDKVEDAAGQGGPVFGAGKDTNKQDLGVTGTG